MPRRVANAKIACLDMNLQKARMMMGVQVLVSDPKELEKVRGGTPPYAGQLAHTAAAQQE